MKLVCALLIFFLSTFNRIRIHRYLLNECIGFELWSVSDSCLFIYLLGIIWNDDTVMFSQESGHHMLSAGIIWCASENVSWRGCVCDILLCVYQFVHCEDQITDLLLICVFIHIPIVSTTTVQCRNSYGSIILHWKRL